MRLRLLLTCVAMLYVVAVPVMAQKTAAPVTPSFGTQSLPGAAQPQEDIRYYSPDDPNIELLLQQRDRVRTENDPLRYADIPGRNLQVNDPTVTVAIGTRNEICRLLCWK